MNDETGEERQSRVLELKECVLNERIAPTTFTIAQFNLENGERYWDKIENRLLVYQNGELVDARDYTPLGDKRGSHNISKVLLATNIVIIVLVAALIWFNKKKRERARAAFSG
jgi:hypothetical protein